MPTRRALRFKKVNGEEFILEITKAQKFPKASSTVLRIEKIDRGVLLQLNSRYIGDPSEIASIEIIREDK